ncbi:hypothetical protein MRB53_005000 [Persea americana]|uniref:Uncharacterized protein n=1 Tax=Persea americana TaxID=3435 RepID=A0ACC2MC46_PERAE|nr:hypothetical protein MRB53_005000 [Persea americana]
MGSIVGRMKANPRKATYIPLLKSPYYLQKNKRGKVSRPNLKYCFSHIERSCLEEFWIRLYSNNPILDDICSTIPKEEMHKTLKKSWIDTLIMDYWLGIVGEHCIGTFFPSTLAHFEVQQKTAEIDLMFTCNKNRDFWTFETVVFPIWFKYHFFLIIGYPKEQRIVYYNSMMGYTSYDDYANHFVDFLRKKFLEVGWIDPMFWSFEIGNPNPQQTNNFDCGIFTMANAEHASYRRAIEYTQADIWYYRQKIVTDIYKKQKQLYSYFFESQKIS